MKTRVITGTVVTLFMLAVVCLYATPVFAIAISVICAMAVYELLRAFEMHKVWILSIPALIIAAVLPTVSPSGRRCIRKSNRSAASRRLQNAESESAV